MTHVFEAEAAFAVAALMVALVLVVIDRGRQVRSAAHVPYSRCACGHSRIAHWGGSCAYDNCQVWTTQED